MKNLLLFSLILLTLPSFGQDKNYIEPSYRTGVLTVRRNIYDTVFYSKKQIVIMHDTIRTQAIPLRGFGRVRRSARDLSHYNHWFYTPNKLYLYSNKILWWNRWRSTKNPEKFIQKMNKKAKKGKIVCHEIPYSFELIYCNETRYSTEVNYSSLIHKYTGDTVLSRVLGVFQSDNFLTKNITYSVFKTKFDTITQLYDSTKMIDRFDNIQSLYRFETVLNQKVTHKIISHFSKLQTEGAFFCGKIENKKRYTLIINPENIMVRKLIFLDSEGEKFLCDYKIENDSIFIKNPPVPGFVAGKLIKRRVRGGFRKEKEKIRFKVGKKIFTFRHKTHGEWFYDKMY